MDLFPDQGEDYSLFPTSQDLDRYVNNPQVEPEYFFPSPPPAPTPVAAQNLQPPNSEQTVTLLLKILEEVTKSHAEDRKKIDSIEKQIGSLKRQIDFLVGKKEDKLERGSKYRERKKQRTNTVIKDFYG